VKDLIDELQLMTRTVGRDTLPAGEAWAVSLSRSYPADIEDVWDAITDPRRIARWFLPVSGDLRLGGRYQLEGNAGGEIRSCEPPSGGRAGYTITWGMGGEPAIVTVTLTEVGPSSTRLELDSVIAAAALPPGMWETYGPGATGVGFDMGVLGLGLYIAGDTSVTPETGAAWQVSDEGKAFTRGSADAWARAHEASGESAEAARAAADATYAFYTGG
jgi:uncharacterized protein YndB with AHSA1/START domain